MEKFLKNVIIERAEINLYPYMSHVGTTPFNVVVSDFCPGLSAYISKTTRPISFKLGIVVGFPVRSIVFNEHLPFAIVMLLVQNLLDLFLP